MQIGAKVGFQMARIKISTLTFQVVAVSVLYAGVLLCASKAQTRNANEPNAPDNLGRLELTQYLDNLAYQKTAARRVILSEIKNAAQAQDRQKKVRQRIIELIGGLPERTPLNAKVVGRNKGDGFRVEKVIFDSLPDFPVTALLYLPDRAIPRTEKLPAIVVIPGHAPQGKATDYPLSSALAQNGFAVLEYDPIGQGERLQYLDQPDLLSPTAQHAEAGLQPTLIGDAVSRYFIWDAMRAVDFLQSRPEVDPNRIGAFGCSGGGTLTAMLGALDPRLKAVAVACFTTNYDTLLPAIGPQEAEQSIPGFIDNGFDIPDWAELVAPKPYAIIATYADMFPFAGVQQTANEVGGFYDLFGARDNLTLITGPGQHGDIQPLFPDIETFFLKNLKHATNPDKPVLPPSNQSLWYVPPANLPKDFFQDTPTGQVLTSYPRSATIHTLNLRHAEKWLSAAHEHSHSTEPLQERIRAITKSVVLPESKDSSQTGFLSANEQPDNASNTGAENTYCNRITIHVSPGVNLRGEISGPNTGGQHPAILLLANAASTPDEDHKELVRKIRQLAQQGNIVLAITPRPSPPGLERTPSPRLGNFYQSELRAELVGKTILGMRVDDTIRAINYLCLRKDVDLGHITAFASGHLGLVLLHTAVLDNRLSHISVDHVLGSYRSLLEAAEPDHAPEDILPGVLRSYDIPDLISQLGERATVTAPLSGSDDLSAAKLTFP